MSNFTAVLGACTRPFNPLCFPEACDRIAAAGYDHVALFANQGKAPVRSDSSADEIVAAVQAVAAAGLTPSMVPGRTRLDPDLDDAVDDYLRLIDNAAEVRAGRMPDRGLKDRGGQLINVYAHPPTDIVMTIEAALNRYRPRRTWVVFQPHQHFRTRFFIDEFADSFGLEDEILVPDVYGAREC